MRRRWHVWPALILCAVVLATLGSGLVWRARGVTTDATGAGCLPRDPQRDHFFPPYAEPPLPAGSGTDPAGQPLTWIGYTKPLAIDFTRAILADDVPHAQRFVAPGVDLGLITLRQRLGIRCSPDTFTVHRVAVRADEVALEPTVYYAEHTVTFRLTLRRASERWWVVDAAPGTAAPYRRAQPPAP